MTWDNMKREFGRCLLYCQSWVVFRVQEFADLPNNCLQTDMAFSPDEQIILTGTSTKGLHDEEGRGKPTYFISCFFKKLAWQVICFPYNFLNIEDTQ